MIPTDEPTPYGRGEIDPLVEEYSARRQSGEPPSIIEEYVRKYAHLAEELRVVLPTVDFVARATRPPRNGPAARLGERIGDYRIIRELGRGGMGVVYEARQSSLGRHVALKILPVQATLDPRFLERFHREAQAAASLEHPNIVSVFGVGEHQGLHFYAMQYIRGKGLDIVIDQLRRARSSAGASDSAPPDSSLEGTVEGLLAGQISASHSPPAPRKLPTLRRPRRLTANGSPYFRSVASIGAQAASALASAHRAGIVHRDIKPSNLLLDTRGKVWVTDFGLCKTTDSGELTQSGDLLGTLRFLPPERLKGQSGPEGDIYSLGITLFELLTLEPAYRGADRAELLHQISQGGSPRLAASTPTIPKDLETIIEKSIAKEPSARYPNASALSEDLRAFLEGRPIAARPPTLPYVFLMTVRRQKLLTGTIVAALAVVVMLSVFYVTGLSRSLRRTRAAGLASAAAGAARTDPMLSLLLAREAIRLEHSPETLSQLQRALAVLHERQELRGHEEELNGTAYSFDGNRILTHTSREVRLWEPDGSPTHTIANENGIAFLALSPVSPQFVTAGKDGVARIWSFQGACEATLTGHRGRLVSARYSRSGRTIVTASQDGEARVWSSDGDPLGVLSGHSGELTSAAISPDGGRVVTTAADGARVWTLTGETVTRWDGPRRLSGATFSPQGDSILVIGRRRAYLRDLAGNSSVILEGHRERITGASYSPDGQTLLTSSEDQTARLWNRDGQPRAVLRGHGGGVTVAAFSPDGRRIATTSNDQTARLWDLDGNLISEFHGHESRVTGVGFSPDGKRLVTSSADRSARIWDLSSEELPVLRGHTGGLYSAVFDPSGTHIFTASRDFTGRLWRSDGTPLKVFEGHRNWVYSAAFTPDGQRIFTTGETPDAFLWNLEGEILSVFTHKIGRVLSASLTEAGIRYYFTRGEADVAVVRNCRGEEIVRLEGHERLIWSAVFSPAANAFLTASSDGTARVWNLAGEAILVLAGHDGPVRYARFSPNGERIVTASSDATARLWNRRGKTLAILEGHEGTVLDATFSPDGERIVTCSRDRTARIWNLAGEPLMVLSGHAGVVWTAEFSPDGKRVVTASNDHTARVWLVDSEDLIDLADRRAFRGFRAKERSRYADLLRE